MFPAVAIDFGPDAPAEVAERVLEACNAAIAAGRCERAGAEREPARSRATVRASSEARVRIEVQRDEAGAGGPIVRVLAFAPTDPGAERWKSVGLAVATLVGEVVEEVRAAAEAAEAGAGAAAVDPLPSNGPAADAVGAPAAASAPTPAASASVPAPVTTVESAPSRQGPVDSVDVGAGRPERSLAAQGFFLGLGVLSAAGTEATPLRFGGAVRGTWASHDGLRLSASVDYSTLSLDSLAIDISWLRASLGSGYRLWHAHGWVLAADAELGVRRLGIEARDEQGASADRVKWSPRLGAGLELGWLEYAFGGIWARGEVSTIFRPTRLLGRDDRVAATLSPVDVSGMLGFWWNIE